MTGEELGDALDLIEFREEIGWPPDRGPAMTERPSPGELAEAERHMRQISDKGDKFARWMAFVMAEYDRRARLLDEAVGTLKRLNPIVDVARGLAEDWFDSRLGDMVNLDGARDELFAELATLFGYENGQQPSDD